jgi:putative flippase GtrA
MSTVEPGSGHAKRGVRFFAVGTTAAATHYLAALAAYSLFGQSPGIANLIGYACGFPVSYSGHRWWTFDSTREPHSVALPRFALLQLTSFTANQVMLLLAVRWLPLPFWFLLGAVLVAVAVGTYIMSHRWVFRT